jgi:hypothetical protein
MNNGFKLKRRKNGKNTKPNRGSRTHHSFRIGYRIALLFHLLVVLEAEKV